MPIIIFASTAWTFKNKEIPRKGKLLVIHIKFIQLNTRRFSTDYNMASGSLTAPNKTRDVLDHTVSVFNFNCIYSYSKMLIDKIEERRFVIQTYFFFRSEHNFVSVSVLFNCYSVTCIPRIHGKF